MSYKLKYTGEQIDDILDRAVEGGVIDDALALKAPLESPALTGTPTAPTAPSGASTEQIATTGFARQEIDGELDRLGVSIVDGALCQTYSS